MGKKKWLYMLKIGFIWGALFSLVNFVLDFIKIGMDIGSFPIMESIIAMIARFLISYPFGVLLGWVMWKRKRSTFSMD